MINLNRIFESILKEEDEICPECGESWERCICDQLGDEDYSVPTDKKTGTEK